jgi:hypothetical protein
VALPPTGRNWITSSNIPVRLKMAQEQGRNMWLYHQQDEIQELVPAFLYAWNYPWKGSKTVALPPTGRNSRTSSSILVRLKWPVKRVETCSVTTNRTKFKNKYQYTYMPEDDPRKGSKPVVLPPIGKNSRTSNNILVFLKMTQEKGRNLWCYHQ